MHGGCLRSCLDISWVYEAYKKSQAMIILKHKSKLGNKNYSLYISRINKALEICTVYSTFFTSSERQNGATYTCQIPAISSWLIWVWEVSGFITHPACNTLSSTIYSHDIPM